MPVEKVNVIWIGGEGCDGCTISVLGATNPSLESVLAGSLPGLPQVTLIHPALAVEAGHEYMENLKKADAGEMDPFVLVLEGSVPDENLSGEGYWIALGEENGQPVKMTYWLDRLTHKAAAVIAIGTCATWGGVPAAQGNVTGAMGLMDFLGHDFRSGLGLPIINVAGCAPIGDNFMETVAALLLYLQGIGPAPELDELGRPAWLYGETVRHGCTRGGWAEEGDFAKEYGDKQCLVELGCWGPVSQCNVPTRGWINGVGGCTQAGGICIGCTMPGFPDKFTPFYEKPPGAIVSTAIVKITGRGLAKARAHTLKDKNKETRWK